MNRRQLLKGFLGGPMALALANRAAAATAAFPLHPLDAHVRMRGNLRGERTYWYYQGTVFGNLWGEATRPMLSVEGVSFSLIDSLPEGSYRYRLTEAGYYGDPGTGQIRDRVLNPYTDEYYRPKHYLSSQSLIFSRDLSVAPDMERLPPGLEYRGVISPVRIFQDQIWSSEDLFVRLPVKVPEDAESTLNFKVQTSLATLTADVRHVLDEERDFVPCQLNYQTLATWREWMNMGRRPGMISWRMTGTKCREEDIPEPIKARIAADHEGFFAPA